MRYNLTGLGAGVSTMVDMVAQGSGQYSCSYTFSSVGSGNVFVEVFLRNSQVC